MQNYSLNGYPTWKSLWLWIFLGATTIPFFGIGIFFITVAIWKRYNHKYIYDGNMVKMENGILTRFEKSIPVERVQSIGTEQDIISRLLQTGNVKFYSSGSDEAEVMFRGVEKPTKVKEKLEKVVHESNS